jgi:hypothetical protein
MKRRCPVFVPTLLVFLAALGSDAKGAPPKPAPKAAETKPADAKPAPKPVDAKPVDAKPTDAKSADAKPAETKPASKPAEPSSVPLKAPVPTADGEAPDDDLGHRGQFHLRAEFLTGYRMLFRYDKSPRCAPFDITKQPSDQQKFCGFGAAPAVGLAVGFSAIDFFEPFVFARLGLGSEADRTNQGKLVQVGVGARLYTMSDSRFKIFFAPIIGLDLTSGPAEPIGTGAPGSPGSDDARARVTPESYRTDIIAHLSIGPQYDISRMVGVYLSGGLTFQMLRYLGASADLALGVQLRAP